MNQMVIANRLDDGLVVFLTPDGGWTGSIDAGAVARDADSAERLLETAKTAETNCQVIDPYLIDIEVSTSGRRPVVFREAIRAAGPTVAATPEK